LSSNKELLTNPLLIREAYQLNIHQNDSHISFIKIYNRFLICSEKKHQAFVLVYEKDK